MHTSQAERLLLSAAGTAIYAQKHSCHPALTQSSMSATSVRIQAASISADTFDLSVEYFDATLQATAGTLYKYIKLVASASLGCVTDM